MDDNLIVAQSLKGDNQAMAILITRYMGMIKAKAYKYKITSFEYDDLVQEGLIGFLTAIRNYDEAFGCSFHTYAGVCVENKIKNAISYHNSLKNKVLTDSISIDDVIPQQCMVLTTSSPENQLLEQEQFDLVKHKLDTLLSVLEHRTLCLYLNGYDYDQIARILSVSKKSVDNSLQRVRKKLKFFL